MKIDKRMVVGIPFLLVFLPFLILGLLAYFPIKYAVAGYEISDEFYKALDRALGD